MSKVRVRVVAKRLPLNASKMEKQINLERMMRTFNKNCKSFGIIQEYKDHEFFTRKCDERRKKKIMKKAMARGEIKPDKEKEGYYDNNY